MAKVKITLDPGETIEEAQENLIKALQVSNALDQKESYMDPLAEALLDELNEKTKKVYREMFLSIGEALSSDVFKSKP